MTVAFCSTGPAWAQNDSRQQTRSVRINGPLGALFGATKSAPRVTLPQAAPSPYVAPAPLEAAVTPVEDVNDYEAPQPLPRPPAYVLNPEPKEPDQSLPESDVKKPEASIAPHEEKNSEPVQPEIKQRVKPAPKSYVGKVKVASADDSVFTMPNVMDFGMMAPDMPNPPMRAPLAGTSMFMPSVQVASLTPTLGPFGMPQNQLFQDAEEDVPVAQAEPAPAPQQVARRELVKQDTVPKAQPKSNDALETADIKPTSEEKDKSTAPSSNEAAKDAMDRKLAPQAVPEAAPLKPAKLEETPVALSSPIVFIPHKRRYALPQGETMTLAEAVGRSVMMHPEIGMAQARTLQAKAGVRVANSSLYPQIDARLTYGGGNDLGNTSPTNDVNQTAGALTLRQLLFDFGATRHDIDRSKRLLDSERFRVLDKVDDIALRTADAYIKVLEQRKLLSLADDYLGAHERLAQLVRLNQNNGNATIADVSRINSRVLEAHTILTSLEADLENATDQLQRLVHAQPGDLRPPPVLKGSVPSQVENALTLIDRTHPRLLSLNASTDSLDADIDSKRMQFLPKVSAEVQSDWLEYSDPVGTSDSNVRGLVVVRQKIFDGLARNGIVEEARAKKTESLLLYRNERDNISADIRQAYRAIESAKLKISVLQQSVDTGEKVNNLYIEQFKGGKRTLFELLDAQSVLYSARRDFISSQYEDVRARLILLRSLGRLAQTLAG